MNEYTDSFLHLPGTAEEQNWLREHLEVLSVKERIALAAAVQRSPPAAMAEAVNHVLTLDHYDVYPASNYAALGEFYLLDNHVPQDQRQFFDKAALGQWYADENPGLFIGSSYVVCPTQDRGPYDGEHLPADAEHPGWSVRLKLASAAVPEGVWIKLPDYDIDNEGYANEVQMALDELQVQKLDECTLLESRCVLPCIGDLAGQYDSLLELIYDGQDLGYILDEHGQGSPDFLERYFAALEYEGCRRLRDAVELAGRLNDYDIVNVDTFLDNATREVNSKMWMPKEETAKYCFDYVAYASALAERQGYRLTNDGRNYIRERDSPALEQQPTGMTMQ